MPSTRPTVRRWAPVVDAELERAQIPLPRELILALIDKESWGHVGLVNPKSGASGLMQVMPGTLDDYNKARPDIPLSTLRSSSVTAAPAQIRVGVWVLGQFWRSAYRYLKSRMDQVPIDELAHIADLFYVAGPGATRSRLDHLDVPTWAAVQARFPKWNALPHPRGVFQILGPIDWPVDAIADWIGKSDTILEDPDTGFVLAVAGILVTWWFLRKDTAKRKDQK
jgi:hypothetical protein